MCLVVGCEEGGGVRAVAVLLLLCWLVVQAAAVDYCDVFL